jgi:hypothetical protein
MKASNNEFLNIIYMSFGFKGLNTEIAFPTSYSAFSLNKHSLKQLSCNPTFLHGLSIAVIIIIT